MNSDMEMPMIPLSVDDNESWYQIAAANRGNVPVFFVELGDEVSFLLDAERPRPKIKRSLFSVAIASPTKFQILFQRA